MFDVIVISLVVLVPCAVLGALLQRIIGTRPAVHRPPGNPRSTSLSKVDRMSGKEFEDFLSGMFGQKGFSVELTPPSGDYGVDLILSHVVTGQRIAVQAKRYSPNRLVGIAAVQEVYAGKDYYDCSLALVVTTSDFTPNARAGADKLGVWLIGREDLRAEMARQSKGG